MCMKEAERKTPEYMYTARQRFVSEDPCTGCPSAKGDVSIGPDREKYSVPGQSSELFMVLNSRNFCQMNFF